MGTPLTSVFRHHKKLVDCQRFDKDHIGLTTSPPQHRRGIPVVLIKKALNAFARRFGMDELDETNDLFDEETADLVTTFKELHRPPIVNFLGQIDAIVGKKTITALDDELPFQPPLAIEQLFGRHVDRPRGEPTACPISGPWCSSSPCSSSGSRTCSACRETG